MKKILILLGSLIAAPTTQATNLNAELDTFRTQIDVLKMSPVKYNALPIERNKLKDLISITLVSHPELIESNEQLQAACKHLNERQICYLLDYPKTNLKLFLEYQPNNHENLIQEWREFIKGFTKHANGLFEKLSVNSNTLANDQLVAMNNALGKLDQEIQGLDQEIQSLVAQLSALRKKFKANVAIYLNNSSKGIATPTSPRLRRFAMTGNVQLIDFSYALQSPKSWPKRLWGWINQKYRCMMQNFKLHTPQLN